ncbi:hypothetical protein MPSEU_000921300 [Mayamaea pseudoterrestris]|nr:hypothetical protein MPSEU_000921300 [Mayamaea pseudoterrestris]
MRTTKCRIVLVANCISVGFLHATAAFTIGKTETFRGNQHAITRHDAALVRQTRWLGKRFETSRQHDYHLNIPSTIIPTADSSAAADSMTTSPEYWLDLRGVSISPNEAIRFLNTLVETTIDENDEEDDTSNSEADSMTSNIHSTFVNRILIDESAFTNRVKTSALNISGVISLLLFHTAPDGVSTVTSMDREHQISFGPFARVLDAQPDRNLDVILAMDTVLGQSKWILIETKRGYLQESVEWMSKQVASLYDLLSSSYGSVGNDDENDFGSGGLIVPTSSMSTDMVNDATISAGGGGIAVTVPTAAALLDIDFTLMQLALARQMKASSSKSDIMLPATLQNQRRANLRTALVVPFDVDIWRLLLDSRQAS